MRFALPPAAFALAVALSCPVFAEDPKPADPATGQTPAEDSYKLGEINAPNVNVRAGNTMNHRIVCVATRGDQVLIVEEAGDFYKILAPKSAACWIANQYVDRKGDTGTITGKDVNLRPTPDTSHPVIGQLAPGDTVKIVGQDSLGTWFRIEPPKGVFAFVSKKFVTLKGDYAALKADEARKESDRIASEEKLRSAANAWAAADALVKAQNDVAAADRDYAEAISAFEEIAQSATDPKLAERAREKADYLKGLSELQQLVKSLDSTSQVQKEEYEKRIAELEQKWQAEQAAKAAKKQEREYIVQGWVEEVGSLWGRPGTHKVVEAGVTLFYLKSGTLDLRRYWHNRIRVIKGTIADAPDGWQDGPKVIDVEEIEVLE